MPHEPYAPDGPDGEVPDRAQITVRLSPALLETVDARAARFGLSRNNWIEQALDYMTSTPPVAVQATRRI